MNKRALITGGAGYLGSVITSNLQGVMAHRVFDIQDVVRVFDFAIRLYELMVKKRLYNVGNPELNISKGQLVERIASQMPNLSVVEDSKHKDPDQRNYIVSNHRLISERFFFATTLEQGIREIVNAYPVLQTPAVQRIAYNDWRGQ